MAKFSKRIDSSAQSGPSGPSRDPVWPSWPGNRQIDTCTVCLGYHGGRQGDTGERCQGGCVPGVGRVGGYQGGAHNPVQGPRYSTFPHPDQYPA